VKILIAEDDPSSRILLKSTLESWDFEVITANTGEEAWDVLQQDGVPFMVILDWIMPKMDGLEICRSIRQCGKLKTIYVILLTAKTSKEDIIKGLHAGADDYMIKPFNREELRARVNVGVRIVNLQHDLSERVRELEDALSNVNLLQGLLPICSYCKKIRDDKNYWQQVESYLVAHSEVKFSHGVCPDCYEEHVEPQLKKLKKSKSRNSSKIS
jgi:phosphoserine phosphatase RsbU/P